MTDDQAEAFEEKIYEEQRLFIKKNFNKKASEEANYGWGVSGDDDHVSIATKVYGHGVLCSVGRYADESITHEMGE